jgi:hypothetical protein
LTANDIIVFTTLGTKASICLQRAFAFFIVAHTLEKLHTPALKVTVEIETSMEYSFFFVALTKHFSFVNFHVCRNEMETLTMARLYESSINNINLQSTYPQILLNYNAVV